jgi:predicted AlkP superfamily pyrophosphatase or phosphodiesterase
MRIISSTILFYILTFSTLSSCAQSISNENHNRLILVSIDGFKPEYLDRGITTNLNKLAQSGVLADGMIPSFPSLTFPNHVTLVTGKYPETHGIVNNTMFDEKIPNQIFKLSDRTALSNPEWWKDVTPIWNLLSSLDMKSGTVFWPGSEVKIHGAQPDLWLNYDHSWSSQKRVEKLLNWIDLTENIKPLDFLTLYFDEVDSIGHEFGTNGKEIDEAIIHIDQAIGQLIIGLEKNNTLKDTTIVIVSDHGMANVPIDHSINIAEIKDNLKNIKIEWLGPLAGFDVPSENISQLLSLLSEYEHIKCWDKEKSPNKIHFKLNSRIPNVFCLAEKGWVISDNDRSHSIKGFHGFSPEDPDMHALFLAYGRSIPHKHIGIFKNTNVYNFLCKLLGIEPEENDGSNELIESIFSAN